MRGNVSFSIGDACDLDVTKETWTNQLLVIIFKYTHEPYASGLALENPWISFKTIESFLTCLKYWRLIDNFGSVIMSPKTFS